MYQYFFKKTKQKSYHPIITKIIQQLQHRIRLETQTSETVDDIFEPSPHLCVHSRRNAFDDIANKALNMYQEHVHTLVRAEAKGAGGGCSWKDPSPCHHNKCGFTIRAHALTDLPCFSFTSTASPLIVRIHIVWSSLQCGF